MRKSLTKNERLKKRSEIRTLFKDSNKVSTTGMKMLFRHNGLGFNRILLSPARQFPTAVKRNRIKRQIREIYRLSKNNLVHGFDIAFVIYTGEYSYLERQSQVSALFQKAEDHYMSCHNNLRGNHG